MHMGSLNRAAKEGRSGLGRDIWQLIAVYSVGPCWSEGFVLWGFPLTLNLMGGSPESCPGCFSLFTTSPYPLPLDTSPKP